MAHLGKERYLARLRDDGNRIRQIGEDRRTAPVTGCPGWSVADLMVHLGEVYEWVSAVLASGQMDRDSIVAIRRDLDARHELRKGLPASPGLGEWFGDELQRLLTRLESLEPDAPVWTWWELDQSAGFWQRRMAQETCVHLWDVQSAAGSEEPIPADMAVDGIDEALRIHLPAEYEEEEVDGRGEVYAFRQTDGNAAWSVSFGSGTIDVEEGALPARLTFSGSASDVLLFIWRRLGTDRVTLEGDAAELDRYNQLLRVDS